MKKILEKFIESLIAVCGTLSTVIVLFIVIFLFKEGSGIFSKPPIEEGYAIAVNKYNLVTELTAEQVKKIIEKDIQNWKEVGGFHDSIYIFTLSDLEYKFTVDELGENFENLNTCIAQYIESNTGVFAIFPEQYLNPEIMRIKLKPIRFWDMLTGEDWYPTASPSPLFGFLPIILGSLFVSLFAMVLAVPLGLIVAIYLAELADKRTANIFKSAIELLSGIPSVVYGFFGIVIVVPFIRDLFHLSAGESALAGSIILAIIALPTIISLSEDAIMAVPKELKQASLALGASHWQSIVKVIVPAAKGGIISASILGIGRAFGETMAVLMVTGNAALMPTSLLQPVRTITATIAAELGEAQSGGLHYEALFILGAVLFFVTFIFNLIADSFAQKIHA